MATNRRVALVTGANRGIGREVARQLAVAGLAVCVGSRDLAAGEKAAREITSELEAEGHRDLEINAVCIDVAARDSEPASPQLAAEDIRQRFGRLDVLINNAGRMVEKLPPDITGSDLETAFITNVAGVAETVHAVLPLLKEAETARIVNVSSTTASLHLTSQDKDFGGDNSVRAPYATSKSALNMLTVHYSKAFQADETLRHIKINAITPGYVATDMNRGLGTRTVEQGARALVTLALRGDDSPTGGYFNEDGPLPW